MLFNYLKKCLKNNINFITIYFNDNYYHSFTYSSFILTDFYSKEFEFFKVSSSYESDTTLTLYYYGY